MNSISSSAFNDSKKHYEILDGLRGVAAIVVVIFHLFEAFTNGNNLIQIINHGYMAVDFFFLLSGFVIGYAYDDRWKNMSLKNFFKRRLIRLHPMIIIGMLIGALTFYSQDCGFFNGIAQVPVWRMLMIMLIGFTLLPVPPSMDIRGWSEMHPLNGPAWTLFFEYIANILYALFIRKFSNKLLALFVFITGGILLHLALTSPNGDVIGGWSLDSQQMRIGFTRLLYPFFAGLLLSRILKPIKVRSAFFICSLILVIILIVPRLGGSEHLWINGLYDAVCIILLFPLIVYLGANGEVKGKYSKIICKFLGDISYPLYIIHYPSIYLFMAWVFKTKVSLLASLPAAALVLLINIVLSYALLKLFDEPARKWLTNYFVTYPAKKLNYEVNPEEN